MDESKRQAAQFLEKEIKTYVALALYLTKKESRNACKWVINKSLSARVTTKKECAKPEGS